MASTPRMVKIHPCRLKGKWREGYALDFHTTKSAFMGYDEYGHPFFDTTYSEVGDLLFRLKYRGDFSIKDLLVETVVNFIRTWKPAVEVIVPVPPTRAARPVQPVLILSQAIGAKLGMPVAADCIKKVRKIPELKGVFDFEERRKLLNGAFSVKSMMVEGKGVLLVDDLYRSGATMNTISEMLYAQGGVAEVYALAVTRTRSKR